MPSKDEYLKKLLHPKWQKRRLEIMGQDEFTCQMCYDTDETLNVHHLIYFPGREPWEYDDCHLITLCEHCHKIQKDINIKQVFADLSLNASTLVTVGFLLSKIITEEVTRPRATEQAIWSFMYRLYADGFREGDMQAEFKKYKAKYIKKK